MQECEIGTRGAVHLFNALRGNSTLQRLSLRRNGLKWAESAGDALAELEVRALDMSGGGSSGVIEAVHTGGEYVVEMDTGDSDIPWYMCDWLMNELGGCKKINASVCLQL